MSNIAVVCGHHIDIDKLPKDPIIVDAGASRGVFIDLVRQNVKNPRIFAIEPSKPNIKLLLKKRYGGNVTIVHRALVGQNSPDKVTFRQFTSKPGWGNIYPDMYGGANEEYEVEVIRINDIYTFFDIPRIDFLKMDIEGPEYDIFDTMTEKTASKIGELAIEIHKIPEFGHKPDIIHARLTHFGFDCEFTRKDKWELWARRL